MIGALVMGDCYNRAMRQVVLLVHDIRSTHNVGSLLRTAEGMGVQMIYFTGYTPYPRDSLDERLPHIARKLDAQIHKTALGAEKSVKWSHHPDVTALIGELRSQGYQIVGLEQHTRSTMLSEFHPINKVAILLGREVEGLERYLIEACDEIVEIPMHGHKESFNVVQATAMTLYTVMHERP